MNSVLQRQMDLRDARKKPLLTIEAVAARIGEDTSRDDVLELIDLGMLDWAWNIACTATSRMEVRILEASLASYLQTGGMRPQPEREWAEVLELVLPGLPMGNGDVGGGIARPHLGPLPQGEDVGKAARVQQPVDCSKLMRLWGASSELGIDLVREGTLPTVPGTSYGRGPGGSAQLVRAGVIQFLKERKL